jgi:hypothetical protein
VGQDKPALWGFCAGIAEHEAGEAWVVPAPTYRVAPPYQGNENYAYAIPWIKKLLDAWWGQHYLNPGSYPREMALPIFPGVFGGQLGAAGVSGQTAMLGRAQGLVKRGFEPEQVRQKTGWFQNPYDKKWRFEIDDEAFSFVGSKPQMKGELGKVIDHPALFRAYPELRKLAADVKVGKDLKYGGQFDGKTIRVTASTKEDARRALIHEIQHWVQKEEGFARGASGEMPGPDITYPLIDKIRGQLQSAEKTIQRYERKAQELDFDDIIKLTNEPQYKQAVEAKQFSEKTLKDFAGGNWFEAYRRHAGEIEAQEVTDRLMMDAIGRQVAPPFYPQSIPLGDAIVKFWR